MADTEEKGLNVIISCQRHGKPIHREHEKASGRSVFSPDGLYSAIHTERAAEIRDSVERAKDHTASGGEEAKGLEEDGKVTRQMHAYAPLIAKKMAELTNNCLPDVSISSPYQRTQGTRELMLEAFAQQQGSSRKNIIKIENEELGPFGRGNSNILEFIANNEKIKESFEQAKLRLAAKIAAGEEPTEQDRTFHVHIVGHELAPAHIAETCLGEKYYSYDNNLWKGFLGQAPFGGVEVVKLDDVKNLAELNNFIEKGGERILGFPDDRKELLGDIIPRELMGGLINKLADVIEVCKNESDKIPSQDFVSRRVKIARNNVEKNMRELAGELSDRSKYDPTGSPVVHKMLYPATFGGDKTDNQSRTNAIQKLRYIDLGLHFILAASENRTHLSEEAQASLSEIGDHEQVKKAVEAVGLFTEVSHTNNLWKQHSFEIGNDTRRSLSR